MADLNSQQTSVQSLYAWYQENRLFVNRRYQRKLVWTLEEKQKLIESILKKYPIPAILLAERKEPQGTFEIIDGLQRLHSIVSFIENSFPLEDGRYFDVEKFPTAKTATEEGTFKAYEGENLITPKEVTTILDYVLAISVMRNATDTEVNDVFDRINTYGHRLSDQERRQSGIENEFSNLIRNLACSLRGDTSQEILKLQQMPSISIDLPKANHGYEVRAEEVFWVKQGILRSTDLRDSLDEQCIADIVACIVGDNLIERSKDALDDIYQNGSTESTRIGTALEIYGKEKVADEIRYCVEQILRVCEEGGPQKLRDIIFEKSTSNAFPSIFTAILIAFHEIIIGQNKALADIAGVKRTLTNISGRIETERKATAIEERRKNIDTVKGLLGKHFVENKDLAAQVYNNHTSIDIENLIRRSELELGHYELKQGLLRLTKDVEQDKDIIQKVANTICAIANNGPHNIGKILIGVTDDENDAKRVEEIYKVSAKKVGLRHIVGVNREAERMKISLEQYFSLWREGIKNAGLSEKLRDEVLSNIDFNSFFGMGLLVITIPPQTEVSYVGDDIYYRDGDQTTKASGAKQIASIAGRF